MDEIDSVFKKLRLKWDKKKIKGLHWDFLHPIVTRGTTVVTSHCLCHIAHRQLDTWQFVVKKS